MLSPKTATKNGSWVCGRLMPSLSCDHENVCEARQLSPPTRKFAILTDGKNREICNFPKQKRFLWNCHRSNSGIMWLRQYATKRVINHFYNVLSSTWNLFFSIISAWVVIKLTLFLHESACASSKWNQFPTKEFAAKYILSVAQQQQQQQSNSFFFELIIDF